MIGIRCFVILDLPDYLIRKFNFSRHSMFLQFIAVCQFNRYFVLLITYIFSCERGVEKVPQRSKHDDFRDA
jgi:hypothetical protein